VSAGEYKIVAKKNPTYNEALGHMVGMKISFLGDALIEKISLKDSEGNE
jgi:hypothetical protein